MRRPQHRDARGHGEIAEQRREVLGGVTPPVQRDDQRQLRVGGGAARDQLDVRQRFGAAAARARRRRRQQQRHEKAGERSTRHENEGTLAEGRLPEAVAELRAQIAVDPDYTIAHDNLARVLRALGRADEAATEDAIHSQMLKSPFGVDVRNVQFGLVGGHSGCSRRR